eukprot:PhF_6_TR24317/c0_g1_i1/m.33751
MGGGQTKNTAEQPANNNNNNSDPNKRNSAQLQQNNNDEQQQLQKSTKGEKRNQHATITNLASYSVESVVNAAVQAGGHEFLVRRMIEFVPENHTAEQKASALLGGASRTGGRHTVYEDELTEAVKGIPTLDKEREALQYVFKLWNLGGDGKLRQREVVKVLKELGTDPVLSDEYYEEIVRVIFGRNVYLTFEVFEQTVKTNPMCASLLDGVQFEVKSNNQPGRSPSHRGGGGGGIGVGNSILTPITPMGDRTKRRPSRSM